MAHPRGAHAPSGHYLSVGGLYPAESDEGAGQARIFPIVYVLHLAYRKTGAASLSERNNRLPRARIFQAKFFRHDAGHSPGTAADWRAVEVQVARGARRHTVIGLR